METVKAITDDLIKFAVDHGDGIPPSIEFATDILTVWDTCKRGAPAEERYEAFREVLSSRWGQAVSRGTAFFVMEKAAGLINALKKTHLT